MNKEEVNGQAPFRGLFAHRRVSHWNLTMILTNHVVVGPVAGVTDGVFRRLAWEQGPALA